MATKPQSEIGAPAALRRLEEHELRCAQECDRLKAERDRLRAMQDPTGDEALRNHQNAIQNAIANLADAQEDWNKALKSLREFDKAVAPEKREGEKVLVSEAKEYYRQIYIGSVLAIEAFILRFCQDAVGMDTPEDIYKAGAESIRQAHTASIEQAKREGVIPKWIDSTPA